MLLRYADLAWLVRLVLGLGGGARILEPAGLAAEVARRAAQALAQADGAAEDRISGNGTERSGDDGCRRGAGGAAVVVALVLVLGVRPHVRRLSRSVAALREDTAARLARLRALRAEAPRRR